MTIAILGVGNILLKDEGVGVQVVRTLEKRYSFPPGIQLIDGGTAGHHLVNFIGDFDQVIVVDAVQGGEPPGTLYRFNLDQISFEVPPTFSIHQVGVLEVFSQLHLTGKVPGITFIGIEPEDISPWGMDMTNTVFEKVPALIDLVIKELEQLGVQRSAVVRREKPGNVSGR